MILVVREDTALEIALLEIATKKKLRLRYCILISRDWETGDRVRHKLIDLGYDVVYRKGSMFMQIRWNDLMSIVPSKNELKRYRGRIKPMLDALRSHEARYLDGLDDSVDTYERMFYHRLLHEVRQKIAKTEKTWKHVIESPVQKEFETICREYKG